MSAVMQRRRGGPSVLEATIGESDVELSCSGSTSPLSAHGRSPLNLDDSKPQRRRRGSTVQICSSRCLSRKRPPVRNLTFLISLMALLLGGVVLVLYQTPKPPFYTQTYLLLWPSPRLPIPRIDVKVPNAIDWPLIHIVNTRFMQDQGPLTTLGMARLHLFLTFCFPTMIAQSTQKFFWIVKTDPKFTTSSVFRQLIEAVQDHPNIYVVASNNNFLITPDDEGSWRDGAEGMDLLKSKIYTGNITKLHQAMALRNERPVLETRLDADDGLHKHFIKYIQVVAMQRFRPLPIRERSEGSKTLGGLSGPRHLTSIDDGEVNGSNDGPEAPRWLYWCTRRHLEWHASSNDAMSEERKQMYGDSTLGFVVPIRHDEFCITPGMTVGFNAGVESRDVPVQAHDHLYRELHNSTACYAPKDRPQPDHQGGSKIEQETRGNQKVTVDDDDEVDANSACLVLVEDLLFCALRSRTWTSAGMKDIDFNPAYPPSRELTDKLWMLLEGRFNIDKTKVTETLQYFTDHRREIAYENMLGQCTQGHSCKEKAKEELKGIMERD